MLKRPLCLYNGKVKELQDGDTLLPILAEGDIIYGDADGNPVVLSKGASPDGSVLKLVSGVPCWVAP